MVKEAIPFWICNYKDAIYLDCVSRANTLLNFWPRRKIKYRSSSKVHKIFMMELEQTKCFSWFHPCWKEKIEKFSIDVKQVLARKIDIEEKAAGSSSEDSEASEVKSKNCHKSVIFQVRKKKFYMEVDLDLL